jgi:hypothetical protein
MWYIEAGKETTKGFVVVPVNLETHQYATEIRAMITIMEQADIPALTHLHQKI